ncbi:formylmethanofuran dehydrogenase subunit A [Azospirillum sp. RWY-5-1]|uniref:Formylmethanofuran dehydrogenase subunit A n=1 Tax=Azospirillum oleiclasticum TaxID=2735135 RepID=A0ABX2THE6_9PROT|nr:formylmethanofuran dehydrogenase subunit A [Azospirillum oleiclasticum]NYZ14478.1 formylmethanofuran dehydrogenase subunit A [Azospirillum oleiclasticum]NYZ23170.1 formylmethanofuran dehydrogenase subunit A [Azospirillum oleiclasticum]
MLTKLSGGRVYDPANGRDGVVMDLYVRDGRIVGDPGRGAAPDETVDLAGKMVMAGAIDIHSHIAGGKVNIARLLMAEEHRATAVAADGLCRCGGGVASPSAHVTGCRYARMGYTAAFEPAMLPSNARHAHLEMADIPLIDTGAYVVLGNDDLLLEMLASGAGEEEIADYVGWAVNATRSLAVKAVNPGGINAFKYNQRRLEVDEPGPFHAVTPRRVLTALAAAVRRLGIPHPLHLHGFNLGVPGNVESTLDSIGAADGLRLHLAHVQFHSYGLEGDRRFSSAAARLAEVVNARPNISVDVGQVMFGQTVTASADTMAQMSNTRLAHPKKWAVMDIECDAGCGVVPFRYRDKAFVNALQWAIGLELFLLIGDPWRVFLTTDHPNGGPFTSYPELIRLLMDRDYRLAKLAELHPEVPKHTILGSLRREYSLGEIATMTRAAPARILGLADRGHLGPGAAADIVVYTDDADRRRMFETPDLVFKDGRLIVRRGEVVAMAEGRTHVVEPAYDPAIERRVARHFEERMGLKAVHFRIGEDEIRGGNGLVRHLCRPGVF